MKIDMSVVGCVFDQNKVLLIHHKKLNRWLPIGGHIEKDETPDHALIREIKEETGMTIEILNKQDHRIEGTTKEFLAMPYEINVHSVGDHDHCCLTYICKAKDPEVLKPKEDELTDFDWFTKEDLEQERISSEIRNRCLRAFEAYEKLNP